MPLTKIGVILMSFTVPTGAVFHSASNNGNTVQFSLPGHTAAKPALLVLKRTVPVYDAKSKTWSKPSYDVKVVRGVLDSDGNPVYPRVTVGTDGIRWPMAGVDVNAAVAASVADFVTVVGDSDFAQNAVTQAFPPSMMA